MGNTTIAEFFNPNFIEDFWSGFQNLLCSDKYFDGRFEGWGLELGTSAGTMYGRDYLANLDQKISSSKDSVHKLQNMLIKNNPKFKTLPIYFGDNNSNKVTIRFANQDSGSIHSIFKDKNVQYLAIDHSKPDLSNDLINKNTASFSYENNFNNNLKLGFAINNSEFSLANNIADNFSFINSTDFASSSPYHNLASNRFSGDNRENQVSSNRFLAAYKFNENWSSNLSYTKSHL